MLGLRVGTVSYKFALTKSVANSLSSVTQGRRQRVFCTQEPHRVLKVTSESQSHSCVDQKKDVQLESCELSFQFNSVQSLSQVHLFETPQTATSQAHLSFTNSWSLLKLMSIESVMPSNHLILCHHLLLPPSNFPGIRVFPNESALRISWPKYWSFSINISPSMNIQD